MSPIVATMPAESTAGTERRRLVAPVAVVVVTHQSAAWIDRCLDSIRRQDLAPAEVVVIDAGSRDGSAARARAHDGVRVVALAENSGFAVAVNRGVSITRAPLVAVLNADVELESGWVAAMVEAARRNPRAASFGSVQRLAADPRRLDGAGDTLHCSGLAWRRGHRCLDSGPECDLEAFSACAAACLIRRSAFLKAGGFPPEFHCYFEDVDLGLRLRLAGWSCLLVSKATCLHAGGASADGPRSDFATRLGHRNMVWSFVRCTPLPLAILLLLPFLAAQAACLVVGALRGQGRVVLGAKLEAIAGLPRILRERARIQEQRAVSAASYARALDWSLFPRRRAVPGRRR